jgi:hypothetical protein
MSNITCRKHVVGQNCSPHGVQEQKVEKKEELEEGASKRGHTHTHTHTHTHRERERERQRERQTERERIKRRKLSKVHKDKMDLLKACSSGLSSPTGHYPLKSPSALLASSVDQYVD